MFLINVRLCHLQTKCKSRHFQRQKFHDVSPFESMVAKKAHKVSASLGRALPIYAKSAVMQLQGNCAENLVSNI